MTIRIAAAAFLAAGSLAATGGVGWAAGQGEMQEATALRGAKVSLTQAIGIAEQHAGGQAFDAGVDIANGHARIVVETDSPKGVETVFVDPADGRILGGHAGPERD
jgi:uncharacterized membrane protein YkoI